MRNWIIGVMARLRGLWIPNQVGDDDRVVGRMMAGSVRLPYKFKSYPTPIGYPCERSECIISYRSVRELGSEFCGYYFEFAVLRHTCVEGQSIKVILVLFISRYEHNVT